MDNISILRDDEGSGFMNINFHINANIPQSDTGRNISVPGVEKQQEYGKKAGSFSLAHKAQDPIAQRREQAFEKARKIVSDAFAGEQKIDAELQELRDLSARLTEDNKEKLDQISQNKQEMSGLEEYYKVPEDSQEQKDLEILMKKNDSIYDPGSGLTLEEEERYNEIMKNGPTEYQSRMMERYSENNRLQREMEENLAAIHANGSALRFVKGERLKKNPMLDAEEAADKVMGAESKAISGEIVGNALDHMQEELQEKVEEAEKQAEQKAEREEQIEKVQETAVEQKIQAEIDKVLEELKLMAEDLKGNAIDKLL